MYSVLQPLREDKFNLPDNCTVFQAEILAIKEGALALSEMVKFYIDSQAVLWALAKIAITSVVVKDTILALNEAAKGRQITLQCRHGRQ